MLIAGLAIALLIGVASAALISYFGQVKMTATVDQAVLLDGDNINNMPIEETATVAGGEFFLGSHWLQSQTSVPVNLMFETYIPGDSAGVTVSYLKSKGYKTTVTTVPIVGDYKVDVTVEDIGDWIQWSFNYFAHNTSNAAGDGKFEAGVIISLENGKKFQIHNNDGTVSKYDPGTWIYELYDGSGWWHGWFGSNSISIKDAGITWVETEGDMYFRNNPEGIIVIRIHKTMLDATFGWGVYASTAHFSSGIPYSRSAYPGNLWDGGFESATIMEEITSPFTLNPGEYLQFYIKYKFAVNIYPDTYTIYSTVKPAS
jgi:hypothetical protein